MAVEFFELQNGNDDRTENAFAAEASKETDVWAFGMTVSVSLIHTFLFFHLMALTGASLWSRTVPSSETRRAGSTRYHDWSASGAYDKAVRIARSR